MDDNPPTTPQGQGGEFRPLDITPGATDIDRSIARGKAFYQVRAWCQAHPEHYEMETLCDLAGLDMLEVVTLLANAQTRVVQDLKMLCDTRTREQRRIIKEFFMDNALNARDFIE